MATGQERIHFQKWGKECVDIGNCYIIKTKDQPSTHQELRMR